MRRFVAAGVRVRRGGEPFGPASTLRDCRAPDRSPSADSGDSQVHGQWRSARAILRFPGFRSRANGADRT